MARMTSQDFVTFLRKRMGNPTTDEWTDAQLLRMINLAQVRIAVSYGKKGRLPTLETSADITTAAQTTETKYELASDCLYVTSVKDVTNGQKLDPDDRYNYIRSSQGSSIPTGEPSRYVETGTGSNGYRSVIFWPEPDGAYTIRVWYIKKPTELVITPTTSVASSVLPEEFDEVILDMATEIGKKWDQQMREASAERQLNSETESRVAGNKPEAPEREFQFQSPVAPSTKLPRKGNHRRYGS